MEWAEDLPEGCPPEDAISPDSGLFFRAVQTFPPTENDFYSPRKLQPNRQFRDECAARALSVCDTIEGCKQLKKHSFFRNHLIASVVLDKECGLIKWHPSALGKSHYEWWLNTEFNPIPKCVEVGKIS